MTDDQLRTTYERLYGPWIHMGPVDKAIWYRFLLRGGNRFAPFTYDVRVGEGTELALTATARERRIAQALSTKRIDVLWTEHDNIVICEVKKRAGASAIGQLLNYKQLYLSTFPNAYLVKLLLVTDELQPDMSLSLFENNIDYVVVGL